MDKNESHNSPLLHGRMYVDMVCYNAESGAAPHISLEELQEAIPDIDWQKGHSGELLSEEIAAKLVF